MVINHIAKLSMFLLATGKSQLILQSSDLRVSIQEKKKINFWSTIEGWLNW